MQGCTIGVKVSGGDMVELITGEDAQRVSVHTAPDSLPGAV